MLRLGFVGLCMGGLYFLGFRHSYQIPILHCGSVWQCTLLCSLWCQAPSPPKSSRSQGRNREKTLLCHRISFWAPRCLINENDPGAESEAIVCIVTKSLPINSILNRISQSTPGVLNLLAWAITKGPWQLKCCLPFCSGEISNKLFNNSIKKPLTSECHLLIWTLGRFDLYNQ